MFADIYLILTVVFSYLAYIGYNFCASSITKYISAVARTVISVC